MNKAYSSSKVMHKLNEILEDPEIGKEKSDAIALLLLYYKHSSKKGTMQLTPVKVDDASELLDISIHRIRKAKKTLMNKGYIENYSAQGASGFIEHFLVLY